MLKKRVPQDSFYGSYLYDRIVPKDHLLRKINAVVDLSFVNDLVKDRYNPDFGRPAEAPEFMLRLCLLQYIYGDSDREVVANARINLAYKYFLGLAVDEEVPDDTTISVFRTTRLGEEKFRQVFQQIVKQCIEKKLVKGKRQIIDSTHIHADAARNSLAGLVRICRRNVVKDIKQQNAKLAEKLALKDIEITKQDRFKKVEEGLEQEIEQAKTLLDTVTEELKAKRLKPTPELVRSLELLEKAAIADREDDSKDRLVSTTDTDARAGKKTGKSWAGYKGHLVVEEESEIITAVETTPANKDDGSQLPELLKQQEKAHELKPEELSGDKAYGIGPNLAVLEDKQITGYLSIKGKINPAGADCFTQDDFKYDAETDTLTCPVGQIVTGHRPDLVIMDKQKRAGIVFNFKHDQCNNCEIKSRCYPGKSKGHGRCVHLNIYDQYYRQMKERMASEEGIAAYRNRYKIEHKVADLARYCGMRRCRYRGLNKARIHTLLSATVSNIKRMARILWQPPEKLPGIPAVAG
jgi:transposase